MKQIIGFISILLFLSNQHLFAQETDTKQNDSSIGETIDKAFKHGGKIKLTESGSSYFKTGMGVHFWARSGQTNPGSLSKQTGEAIPTYTDFAMRRMRMTLTANIESRFILYTQFGLTSQPYYGAQKQGMYIHSFWGKMAFAPKNFIGFGQHMYTGLSRLSLASYGGTNTLDNPAFNFPEVNVWDLMVRQTGIFVHGQVSKLEYQASVNKPMLADGNSRLKTTEEIKTGGVTNKAYNRRNDNFQLRGYAFWSFFEMDKGYVSPYKSLSYYGKKKVLNVGAGFQYNPEASGTLKVNNSDTTVSITDQLAISADIMWDLPLPQESGFTIYAAYYNYAFGQNYIKTTNVMGGFATADPNATRAPEGIGFAQYAFGTGQVLHANFLYVIPKSIINMRQSWAPYYSFSYKDLEALKDPSFQQDFGIHYLIRGNNLRLTAQYSTRPLYNQELKLDTYKGLATFQMQFKI